MTLFHHEAKILLNLTSELQQEGLSFAEARPLLTRDYKNFIDKYGPNTSGKIRMRLRDIAQLKPDDFKKIDRVTLTQEKKLEEIALSLGYAPILIAQSPSTSASAAQPTHFEMAYLAFFGQYKEPQKTPNNNFTPQR